MQMNAFSLVHLDGYKAHQDSIIIVKGLATKY